MIVNRAPFLVLQSETETQDPGQLGCHVAKLLSLGTETQGRLSLGSRLGSSDQIRTHELSGSQASVGECSFHVGQKDLKVCFWISSDQASSLCT